ncbi:hypothetical protein [Solirhodobacter olei]|uniref:hypothetical protein n=1 Tax=Solirhodobacter olei TaxID=2493082 RepID=UPI000FD77196|nr:hypothetical protein [Solirhodobacter olei]
MIATLAYWFAASATQQDGFTEFVKSVSVNIFSATVSVLIVYGAYQYFIHEDTERPEVDTIRPGDIGEEIRRLPQDTTFYFLWARSGTYFRAETLKRLTDHAIKNRKTVDVTVLLPDPEIDELSQAYEDMSVVLGEGDGKDKLFKNAVATAAACALASANNRNIKIKVCLSKFIPSFRIDMSEQGALLTEDDKALYALRFSRKSQFFEMFRTMMTYEVELSRVVDLTSSCWKTLSLEGGARPMEALLSLGFSEEKVRAFEKDITSMIAPKDHRYK